jgi:hypothetical protein
MHEPDYAKLPLVKLCKLGRGGDSRFDLGAASRLEGAVGELAYLRELSGAELGAVGG